MSRPRMTTDPLMNAIASLIAEPDYANPLAANMPVRLSSAQVAKAAGVTTECVRRWAMLCPFSFAMEGAGQIHVSREITNTWPRRGYFRIEPVTAGVAR